VLNEDKRMVRTAVFIIIVFLNASSIFLVGERSNYVCCTIHYI